MTTAATQKKVTDVDVDLKTILKYWTTVDSHQVFEGHLPQLIPLDYIEEVYIPKTLFASLTPAAQESAQAIFRNSLYITEHKIDPTASGGGGPQPTDKDRADYQDYVVKKLIAKFDQCIKHSRHIHGSVITVAPSQFVDHIVVPLTISQAREQYRLKHKHDPDDTYIYWQSMYGDMMITVSDESIDPGVQQPNIQCLVCYVAEKPSTTTSDYRESVSYLNYGEPYRHAAVLNYRSFASSSNNFHRGCNTDDFSTYCLRIQQKTGQVTLSNAGPNSIYNSETISYKFPKTRLNLSKLNYIHVSAGSQKVPIRNLVLSFEQEPDLHPSFDKDFKRGSISFPGMKTSTTSGHAQSATTAPSPDDKSPSFFSEIKNKVVDLFAGGYGHDDESTKRIPCPRSINCLLQGAAEHMKKFSHPCQYSELCQKKDDEPHLTHEPHAADQCSSNRSCKRLDDPVHRTKYRHSGMPDFLIPCRDQQSCQINSFEHRVKYSHGEDIEIKAITTTRKY
ncbi:unnamed protein product, partial [Didymodactylos carnosus]